MKTHDFRLILDIDPDEDGAERLAEAFDDGTIASIGGVPEIWFDREAKSLEEAIRSAIDDVRKAGFSVIRIEMESDWFSDPVAA